MTFAYKNKRRNKNITLQKKHPCVVNLPKISHRVLCPLVIAQFRVIHAFLISTAIFKLSLGVA